MTGAALGAAITAALRTQRLGHPLTVRTRTGSTMDEARALVRSGAGHGAAVVAEEQTAGRGRLGRPFVSPHGGLYLTVILDPPGVPGEAWRCGFAAALAARDALCAAGAADVEFDWPNDLVVESHKVGGILMELLAPETAGAAGPLLLLGVGLNVGGDPAACAPDAAGPAGPVRGLRGPDPRATVAAEFLGALEPLLPLCGTDAGWGEVLQGVRDVSRAARGARVSVRAADGRLVEGRGAGLREDGAIEVRQDDGTLVVVRYGERIYRHP